MCSYWDIAGQPAPSAGHLAKFAAYEAVGEAHDRICALGWDTIDSTHIVLLICAGTRRQVRGPG